MGRRHTYSRRMQCTEPGCAEGVTYQYDTRRDYDEAVRRNRTWTCLRHSKGSGVLSVNRLKVEWISAPNELPKDYPRLTKPFFGSAGLICGDGYYAEAKDFPIGTRIKITAEVILPEEEQ